MHATCSAHLIRVQFLITLMSFHDTNREVPLYLIFFSLLSLPLSSVQIFSSSISSLISSYNAIPSMRRSFTLTQNSQKYSKAHFNVGSCDNVVCVVRRLLAGSARYRGSTLGIDNKIYLFSKASSLVLVPTHTPTREMPRPLFLGIK